jgi:hypothetical protein
VGGRESINAGMRARKIVKHWNEKGFSAVSPHATSRRDIIKDNYVFPLWDRLCPKFYVIPSYPL